MRPPGVSESRSPNGAPTAHASRIVSVGLPGATVVACASTLWALSDVPLMNVVVYLLYVVGVLLVPGVLTYFVLARQSCLDLNAIAYGGALGLAIELGAFWLGAALALRTLSVIVPLAIGATALVFLRSRRTPFVSPGHRRGDSVSRWPVFACSSSSSARRSITPVRHSPATRNRWSTTRMSSGNSP